MLELIGGMIAGFAIGFALAATASRKVHVTVRTDGGTTTTEIHGHPQSVAEVCEAMIRQKPAANIITGRETIQ